MKDLTRDEARARAALLDVHSYAVHLDLTGEDGFDSTTTVRFAAEPGSSTFLELDGELVSISGASAGPPQGNRIPLADLAAQNEVVVRARCAYSRTGEGLHRFLDPADGRAYLWQQSFLDDAQRTFACFDQPDLKATIELTVDAPQGWTVVANARGTQDGARWTFAPTERISTYLFHVSAGEWASYRRVVDGVELGLHCRQSLAPHLEADADELFEVTGQCFALQQRLFGRAYPFGDTYDQLFVPEFNHGAMENPGAVTFTEDFVFRSRVTDDKRRKRAMVVAHEMAHMWFGDLVTMRWWDDLWLNESFAELLGYLTVDRATRFERTWEDFSASRKAWGYRADALPSTHPVQGDVADNRSALLNFDGISYAKGASVLRQLMATVGEDAFFAAVQAYMARHAFASTTFDDLLAELSAASGRDLREWAAAWLQTTGTSVLRGVVAEDVRVVQEAPVPRPHRIGVGLYDRSEQGLVLRDRLDVALDGTHAVLDLDPADAPDLLLPNDGDLTFAKVRLDERSLATARTDLARLPDPMARALVWSSLWDAARDAELPAAHFVEAVLAGVDGEADPAVAEALLAQARTAALLYSGDPALRDALAAHSLEAVDRDAGSDLQLVHARAYAAVVREPEVLLSWLEQGPKGLAVDTELRWHLVECLAALGEDRVDDELARDDADAGRRHAMTARAALPTATTKAAAWDALMDGDLSNAEVRATASGFWRAGQDELLSPYVERYVADLPAVWPQRSPQVAGTLAELLFPRTLVTQEVLDATAPLEAEPHPAGLRRYVAEQRSDLSRAVRARALPPE